VGVIAGKRMINRLLSANDLVLVASFEQGLLHALDLFLLRASMVDVECKSALKRSRYYVSPKTKASARCK